MFFTTSQSLQRADRIECTRMSNKHHRKQYTEEHISNSSSLRQENGHEASLGYVGFSRSAQGYIAKTVSKTNE